MKRTQIADHDLVRFCQWYQHHFGKCEDAESVFITCLCGHFHSYEKAMKELLKRMRSLGLVNFKNQTITII